MNIDFDEIEAAAPGLNAPAPEVGPSPTQMQMGVVDESPPDNEQLEGDNQQRMKRLMKPLGPKLNDVLGKIVIDLGEYKKKKAKLYLNYEGWGPDALDEKLRLRSKVVLPEKWVHFKVREGVSRSLSLSLSPLSHPFPPPAHL